MPKTYEVERCVCGSSNIAEYFKGETCPACNGKGWRWVWVNGDVDRDVCDICEGKGILQEDIYTCRTCRQIHAVEIEEDDTDLHTGDGEE